ncbi:MAG: hypothetical protein OXG78_09040 [Chloroflexi bacterium]|nr:hypothetical protein [Chloroflexota bacterium]
MDWNYVALIAVTVTLLLLMIQRTEPKRRRLAIFVVVLCSLVIRHNAFLKGDLHDETLVAFLIALVLSLLFWLLIGRYNPVKSEDNVRVLGMDD